MADADTPRLVPLGGPAGDRFDYKPVSGYAVAAVCLAGLYTVAVLVLAVAAVIAKKPILIEELLVLPLAAVILAIVGRSSIRGSNGARIGLGLCSIAWWLSVLGGVGFGMYIWASDVALRKQSEREANRWLNYVKEDKWNSAFVLAMEPTRRASVNDKDIDGLEAEFGKASIAAFRQNEVIRLFQRWSATGEISFDSLGIKSWVNAPAGYEVLNAFRIRCPEGVYDLTLALHSREGPNIKGREWYVALPVSGGVLTPEITTDFGRLMFEASNEVAAFGSVFVECIGTGQTGLAMAMTAGDIQGREAQERRVARVFVGGLGAMIMPEKVELTPEFERTFFRLKSEKPVETNPQSAAFNHIWKEGALRPAGSARTVQNPEKTPYFRITDTEFTVLMPVEIGLQNPPRGVAAGRLLVTAESPEFVAAAAALRKSSFSDPRPAQLSAVLPTLPPPQWRIAGIESNLEPLPSPPPMLTKP